MEKSKSCFVGDYLIKLCFGKVSETFEKCSKLPNFFFFASNVTDVNVNEKTVLSIGEPLVCLKAYKTLIKTAE